MAEISPTLAGVALLAIGLTLLIAEAHVPSGGIFGLAGGASLVAGGVILYEGDSTIRDVAAAVMVTTGVAGAAFAIYAGRRTLEAHRQPAKTGWEELVGAEGVVKAPLDPIGQVFVEGALWRARPSADGASIPEGRVVVDRVEGLTLHVRPVDSASGQPHLKE